METATSSGRRRASDAAKIRRPGEMVGTGGLSGLRRAISQVSTMVVKATTSGEAAWREESLKYNITAVPRAGPLLSPLLSLKEVITAGNGRRSSSPTRPEITMSICAKSMLVSLRHSLRLPRFFIPFDDDTTTREAFI